MPAAHIALERAGLSFADVDAITMHDPFADNDLLTRDHAFRPA